MKIAVPMLYLYKFSVLENFVSYLRNNYNNYNKATTLSELSELSERFKCSECQLKLVATEIGIEHDDLQQPFRGVHQVLPCVISFSKPLALLTLFHQQ